MDKGDVESNRGRGPRGDGGLGVGFPSQGRRFPAGRGRGGTASRFKTCFRALASAGGSPAENRARNKGGEGV